MAPLNCMASKAFRAYHADRSRRTGPICVRLQIQVCVDQSGDPPRAIAIQLSAFVGARVAGPYEDWPATSYQDQLIVAILAFSITSSDPVRRGCGARILVARRPPADDMKGGLPQDPVRREILRLTFEQDHACTPISDLCRPLKVCLQRVGKAPIPLECHHLLKDSRELDCLPAVLRANVVPVADIDALCLHLFRADREDEVMLGNLGISDLLVERDVR